jgi:hypothetical protein
VTTPWGPPPAAAFEFGLADHVGVLAFFVVGGMHANMATSFGEKDGVRCSIVMLDGPEAGKEFEDIVIFNTRPVARLRNSAGNIILARIGMGQGKGGNNAPIELLEATPQDQALAAQYHQYYPQKLEQLRQAAIYGFQMEERKAAQGMGRPTSSPHPTHAGSRAPANGYQQQAPPAPPSAPPAWSGGPPAPPAPPAWGQPAAPAAAPPAPPASAAPPWAQPAPAQPAEPPF